MSKLLLAMAGLGAAPQLAPHAPVKPVIATWQECRSDTGCRWFAMPKAERRPLGHWSRCTTSPTVTVCVQYPLWHRSKPHNRAKRARAAISFPAATSTVSKIFRGVSGDSRAYYVTGYSWGCGTPNRTGANGYVPFVGMVSNDWLAFGTRIYVPSLGYSGVVEDRGVGTGGFDLFEPSCAAAYTVTGWRQVVVG